ncbi:MAG: ABC transporter ATP-binding protein [Armatimonadota bacterium]|nr:ABC transporter ATP-binding protein [Armatimonadota bacterium]MDR7562722.1 ABC transporter ATP-binding protein [Armatimonadota bacterium]MDR7567947.1 ABC transporter ATP-binding protein [Armatimonadota bacterium]MDR7601021.1 ABC transporter ATP-binding protein [Armatimonadota bacterium]
MKPLPAQGSPEEARDLRGHLQVYDLHASYGPIQALRGATLECAPGEFVAVIGPNGAGKSTLLRAILGLLPHRGEVLLDGRSLRALPTENRVRCGLALVPERRQLFDTLSVLDNLLLSGFGRGLSRPRMEERLRLVFSLFPVLAERQRALARSLSGGQQQMLAIGRALMSEPCVLLMDEPLLGLAPLIVSELLGLLRRLCAQGLSVVLVEQNARAALSVADRAYVLERGRIVQSGPARDLQADPAVQRAYLGGPPEPEASSGRES